MKKKQKRLKVEIREKIDNEMKLSGDNLMLLLELIGVLFICYWIFRP